MTRPAVVTSTLRAARRLLLALLAVPLVLTGRASIALALTANAAPIISQTPSGLAWITVKDSNGIPLWNYELNIDDGGINSPDLFIWAPPAHALWTAYQSCCAIAIWIMEQALSFEWFTMLSGPAVQVGNVLHHFMTQVDLRIAAMSMAGLAVAWFAMRARYATAVYEFAAASIISALAVGAFANPVALVAGPDGLIMKARETALAAVSTTDASTPGLITAQDRGDAKSKEVVAGMVDVFVRGPHQYVNFGRPLVGTKCESTYNTALKAGPYGKDNDGLRNKVGECDTTAKAYADAPGPGMIADAASIWPAGAALIGFGVIVAASLFIAAAYACYRAALAVWDIVAGILPGGGRAALASTIAQIVQEAAMVFFILVFLVLYQLFIAYAMAPHDGQSIMKRFWLVDFIVVAGSVIAIRERRRIKMMGQRLAGALATRPAGSLNRPTERQPGHLLANAGRLGQARNLLPSRRGGGSLSASGAGEGAGAGFYSHFNNQQVLNVFQGAPAGEPPVAVGGGLGRRDAPAGYPGGHPGGRPTNGHAEHTLRYPDASAVRHGGDDVLDGEIVHRELGGRDRAALEGPGAPALPGGAGPDGPDPGSPSRLQDRLDASKPRVGLPSPAAARSAARLAIAGATGGISAVAVEGARQAASAGAGKVIERSAKRREVEAQLRDARGGSAGSGEVVRAQQPVRPPAGAGGSARGPVSGAGSVAGRAAPSAGVGGATAHSSPAPKAPAPKTPVTKTPVTKAPDAKAPVTKAPSTRAPVGRSAVEASSGRRAAPVGATRANPARAASPVTGARADGQGDAPVRSAKSDRAEARRKLQAAMAAQQSSRK